MRKKLQAKHLDDHAVIAKVGSGARFASDLAELLGVPRKVVLAKMRKLIRRKLVSGCACGCRGDFELTTKGRDALAGVVR